LTDWGRNKIATIKYFRQYSGYGLRKSKDTIDRLDAGVYVCLNDHVRSVDIPAAVNDLTMKANCNVIRSETLQPT
jgi:ribosomal protein L7/L12